MEGVAPDERDAFNGGRQIGATTLVVVLRYVRRVAGSAAVERVLELAGIDPADPRLDDETAWVTYREAVAVFEAAAEVTGDPEVARRSGEEMLRQYAGSEVAVLLRSLGSPTAVLENVTATAAKFSTVTEMAAVELADDHAVVEARTTPPLERSPQFCRYQAGILSQTSALFGLETAEVEELECQTRGDGRCLFRVTYGRLDDPDPQVRIARLEQDLAILEGRFRSLQSTATELVSATTVEEVLAAVTRRAGRAVRAPQFLLAARLRPDEPLRVRASALDRDSRPRAVSFFRRASARAEATSRTAAAWLA